MRNTIKYIVSAILIFGIYSSCTNEDLKPYPKMEDNYGAVTLIEANPLKSTFNSSNDIVSEEVEFNIDVDGFGVTEISSVDVELVFIEKDGTVDAEGNPADLYWEPVLLDNVTTIPSTVNYNGQEVADALGLSTDYFKAGDIFQVTFPIHTADGRRLTVALSSSLCNEPLQPSYGGCSYTWGVSCYSEAEAVGEYEIVVDEWEVVYEPVIVEAVAGPGENEITLKNLFGHPQEYDVVIQVNPLNGNVTVDPQVAWNYDNWAPQYGYGEGYIEGTGLFFSCIGQIVLDLTYSLPSIGYSDGTYKVVLQKPSGEVIPVEDIALSETDLVIGIDDTTMLEAEFTPVNATNQDVTWSSSDENIATVVDGEVVGKDVGSVTISATSVEDGTKIATCDVNVIRLTLSNDTIVITKGDTYTNLKAVIEPASFDQSVSWSILDESVALISVVSNDLSVWGVRGGITKIVAEKADGKFTDTCTVIVTSDNSIPEMTSNTNPAGSVIFNPDYLASQDPYLAFDNDDGTYWCSTTLDAWIGYEFSEPTMINQFTILPHNQGDGSHPKAFEFQALNADDEWVTLHDVSDITSSGVQTYQFANNTAYTSYRLLITDNNGSTNTCISTFEMGYGDH